MKVDVLLGLQWGDEGKKISTRIPYYLFKEKRYPTGQLIRQLRTVKSSITDQDSRHRL